MSNAQRTEVVKSSIKFERFFVNDFQKAGSKTAELSMVVTTKSWYPSKKVDSNLSDNLFAPAEFGYSEQEFVSTEKRMAWMIVPSSTTEEDFKGKLAAALAKGATIYRVLSIRPILDENQLYAINNGIRTKEQFANGQASRYPENEETIAKGTAGKLILDSNSNVTYRRTFFSITSKADIDERFNENIEPWVSAELEAELLGASVFEGQSIM